MFGDAGSDDSDDMFSVKKSISKKEPTGRDESRKEDLLKVGKSDTVHNMKTSTPQNNLNSKGLFSDDEDDNDLFYSTKKKAATPTNDEVARKVSILLLINILKQKM